METQKIAALLLLVLASVMAPPILGQNEGADALFEKGLFQKALEAYEKEAGFRAFFRAQESKGLLQRYAESAQTLFEATLPSTETDQGLFLLLRTQISREFLKRSGDLLPKDSQSGTQDVTRWTQSEWQSKIAKDFLALHSLRNTLVKVPIESAAYFIRIEGSDTELIPTLWDFTVGQWTDYLTSLGWDEPEPDADEWIQQDFVSKVENTLVPRKLAAALWDEAANLEGPNRALAREHARWRRVFPSWAQGAKSVRSAEKLVSLFETFRHSRARALAGTSAAEIYQRAKEEVKALALCEKVAEIAPTIGCKQVQESVLAPELEIESFPSPPLSKIRARVKSRNYASLHFRLYATTQEQLQSIQPSEDWSFLRALNAEAANQFLKQKPIHTTSVSPKPNRPYGFTDLPLSLPPALPEGFYVLLVAEDPHFKAALRGAVLNVTELVLFADRPLDPSRGKSSLSLRVFSGKTGLPEEGAKISIRSQKSGQEGTSSKEGYAEFQPLQNQADPLVQKHKSAALLPHPLWLSFSDQRPTLSLHIDTDRAIYRPGQTVRSRLTVFRAQGNRYSLANRPQISIRASDANGKVFFTKTFRLQKKLSTSFDFLVPTGVLLGQFSITAEGKEKGTSTQGSAFHSFQVEEYVRPDFELKLHEKTSLVKNSPVTVSGSALTYSGSARKGQAIHFRVSREEYLPVSWRFLRGLFPTEPQERLLLSQGTTLTNSRGEFEIPFVASTALEGNGAPSRYIVEVTSTGASGKTVQTSKAYLCKSKAILIRKGKPFFSEGESIQLGVDAFTENSEKIPAKGTLFIHALDADVESPVDFSANDLETLYATLPLGKQVAVRPFDTLQGAISLPALPTGVYRVSVEAGEVLADVMHFIVWSKALAIPAVALPEYRTYNAGDTAIALIGSSDLKGKMAVEIWKGEEKLSSELVDGGTTLHTLPILPSYRGGILLRWYGVYGYKYRAGESLIEVDWADRKLVLKASTPKTVKPQSRAHWTFELLDYRGRPVDAEGLLSVYDASLDTYAAPGAPWVESLYGSNFRTGPGERSYSRASFAWLSAPNRRVFPEEARFLPKPRLRVETEHSFRTYSLGAGGSQFMPTAAVSRSEKGAPAAEPQVSLRSDFRETAYFAPQLYFNKGVAVADFAFPDSITRWSVNAFAIDTDLRFAALRTETMARQDFSVSLSGPRFFREEDRASLTVVAANHSPKSLNGKATLLVEFPSRKKKYEATKAFKVMPGQTSPLTFAFSVPVNEPEAKVTATAVAGSLRDGETKVTPIFSNRFRSVASKIVSLTPNQETEIEVTVPANATLESTTLQVDPELASVWIQAIPLLAKQTQKDSPSVADRLVSLAFYEDFLKKYPHTQPKRTTRTGKWASREPRQMVRTEETPWAVEAEGLGDAAPLSKAQTSALLKGTRMELENLQTQKGGFPWFSGGKEDFTLTLHVLGRLSEAKRSGLTLSTKVVERAAAYLKHECALTFTPTEGSLANRLFAAHTVSVLYAPQEWKSFIEETLRLAQKHSDVLNPYGKGLVADIAFRSGNPALGDDFLSKALDGARENGGGLYWTAEKMSWHWYADTVDKHAFFLRLLLDWKPQDPKVHPLAKWLVLNRKTNLWKSTRNSASAVAALMEYHKKRGLLHRPQAFEATWAGQKLTKTLAPGTALEEPLRWTKKPTLPSSLKASIHQIGEGIGFASLTSPYTSPQGMDASSGLLSVSTQYFVRTPAADGNATLAEIRDGAEIPVGTEVEAVFTLTAETPIGYVGVRAPRAAGFEPANKTSQWFFSPLPTYREIRDSMDSFFLPEVPKGEVLLRASFFAEQPGRYQFGPVTAQSVYSPDISATARGFSLSVVPRE
jgi:alpha-2-macroglobulin